jgi:magnesium-transporting ATPase (P-type)
MFARHFASARRTKAKVIGHKYCSIGLIQADIIFPIGASVIRWGTDRLELRMKQIAQPATANAGANPSAGLSTSEARQRLSEVGPNEPVSSHRKSSVVQILLLFVNPLAIILLVASAISAAVGEVLNASIIALMVLLSAALNFCLLFTSPSPRDST